MIEKTLVTLRLHHGASDEDSFRADGYYYTLQPAGHALPAGCARRTRLVASSSKLVTAPGIVHTMRHGIPQIGPAQCYSREKPLAVSKMLVN